MNDVTKDVAKINLDNYFGKGKKSLLERKGDLSTLLLQLAIVVNGSNEKLLGLEKRL